MSSKNYFTLKQAREKLYAKGRDLLALDNMLSDDDTASPDGYPQYSMYDAGKLAILSDIQSILPTYALSKSIDLNFNTIVCNL